MGASITPALFCTWCWVSEVVGSRQCLHLGCVVLCLLVSCITLARFVWGLRMAWMRRRDAAREAGVFETFSALACKGALLCRAGQADAVATNLGALVERHAASAPRLAAALELFETQIRLQQLAPHFLRDRDKWLMTLRKGRASYSIVAASAKSLLGAMQTPPMTQFVIAALKTRTG